MYKDVFDENKVAIVYWRGTGNTQAMAQLVEEGATAPALRQNSLPLPLFLRTK